MARVLLAALPIEGLQKLVVLKCMREELAGDPELRASFVHEAQLMARMNHPNIVQILDVHSDEGSPVIAMEYLEGQTLNELHRDAARRLPLGLELLVLVELLRGLEHFHLLTDEDGVPLRAVHRDVSPQNTFITYEGVVKVLDFGIARVNDGRRNATSTGIIKGKLRYMAPEQLMSEPVDLRTDLFSVGVMIWEAVTGRPLWPGSDGEIMKGLVNGTWGSSREIAPQAPEALHLAIESVLQLEPGRRLNSAAELRQKLINAMAELDDMPSIDGLAGFMKQAFQSELVHRRRRVAKRLASDSKRWSSIPPALQAAGTAHNVATLQIEVPRSPGRSARSRHVVLAFVALTGIAGAATAVRLAATATPLHPAERTIAVAQSVNTAEVPEGPPIAPPPPPPPFPPCATPNTIADFEDGNPGVCESGPRGGNWFFFFDGTGVVEPNAGVLSRSELLPEPRGASKYALHIRGTGQTRYGSGLSATLGKRKPYDASGYQGVVAWIFSPRAVTVDIKLATVQTLSAAYGGACESTPQADCDDHYGARFSVGPHWKFLRVPFKSLLQLEHGIRAPFDPRQALELVVRIPKLSDAPLSFDVWIDDVLFY